MDPVALASCAAASAASSEPWESTPFTSPPIPDSTPISPALPLITVGRMDMRASAVSVRYAVAPAPTGSRSMGMPLEDAVRNATSIEPTVLALSVPMLTTVDDEIDTMSATSSPSVMTGEPPAQMQMLAQSLTVT